MKTVGYFYCGDCMEERIFVLYAPPWDANMASCDVCGFEFGYLVEPVAHLVDEDGADPYVRVTAAPRPVLAPEVLEAGIRKYQTEVADELKRRYGGRAYADGYARLDQGLATDDPAERARLLGSRRARPR